MTSPESIALNWLQTTMMSNSAYPYYSQYFAELLNNDWTESMCLELPPDTFEIYEMVRGVSYIPLSDYAHTRRRLSNAQP